MKVGMTNVNRQQRTNYQSFGAYYGHKSLRQVPNVQKAIENALPNLSATVERNDVIAWLDRSFIPTLHVCVAPLNTLRHPKIEEASVEELNTLCAKFHPEEHINANLSYKSDDFISSIETSIRGHLRKTQVLPQQPSHPHHFVGYRPTIKVTNTTTQPI